MNITYTASEIREVQSLSHQNTISWLLENKPYLVDKKLHLLVELKTLQGLSLKAAKEEIDIFYNFFCKENLEIVSISALDMGYLQIQETKKLQALLIRINSTLHKRDMDF